MSYLQVTSFQFDLAVRFPLSNSGCNILSSLLPCQYKAGTDSQILVSMNIFQFLTCLTDDMTCLAAPSHSMNRSGKINAGTRHRKGISDIGRKGIFYIILH